MNTRRYSLVLVLLLSLTSILLLGCTPIRPIEARASTLPPNPLPTASRAANACPVTEPVWVKPPADSAVLNAPVYGDYFVNQDRSLWASAGWTDKQAASVRAGEEGIKVGWFRPAGVALKITGQRLDGEAPPLHAHIPCCYPTRFQATGLFFPTAGCWQVTAKAAESELSFVVRVEP